MTKRTATRIPGALEQFEKGFTVSELQWEEIDRRAVDTARILAADAVEKVGNGHPGTAMSLAPAAYLLYQRVPVSYTHLTLPTILRV